MYAWFAQSLKGVGGEIVVLEEAAYCDPQVVKEVVLPLLSVSSSVLLCISTLREDDNHYSRMFQKKKPDGSMLFHTIQISTVCDKCRQSDAPEKCNHKQTEMPRWLSSHKMEMIKNMLSDDPALLLRESMGISVESTSRAFKDAAIDDLVKSDQVFPMLLSHIYVAVDPSGGGDSAFAIASIGIMSNGDTVVRARPNQHSAYTRPTASHSAHKRIHLYGLAVPKPTHQRRCVAKHLHVLAKTAHKCWHQHRQDGVLQRCTQAMVSL